MPPIRRYLRITKYSVLECRIYLDNPALAQSWLLHPRNPILPKVIEAVRPLVLPKLEEEKERERHRRKGTKKKSIKDVVTTDEFEVAIFLTQTQTRHSLLYKKKHFRDKTQTKLTSNSSKLVGASSEAPIDLDEGGLFGGDSGDASFPGILREESEDGDVIALENIPSIDDAVGTGGQAFDADAPASRRPKRRRQDSSDHDPLAAGADGDQDDDDDDVDDAEAAAFVVEDSDDELFVRNDSSNESEGDNESLMRPPPSKRRKERDDHLEDDDDVEGAQDDKKKLAMHISYDGFAIYGRVLCLVVKRRDGGPRGGRGVAASSASAGDRPQAGGSQTRLGGQASMENWITSTQVMADMAEDMETA